MTSDVRSKLTVAVCGIVLIALVAMSVLNTGKNSFDPKTRCRKGTDSRAVAVLLLDQSDRFEAGDSERTRQMTLRVIESLQTDEKLIAIELDPSSPYEPSVIFERCAPKRQEAGSILFDDMNALSAAHDTFSSEFWKHTEVAFERKELESSPLIESLAYISQREDFRRATSRRVYIFSDFLQHSEKLDFYKHIPPASSVTDNLMAVDTVKLSGAHIYLLRAARRPQWYRRTEVQAFWNEWLRSRGAVPSWDFGVARD